MSIYLNKVNTNHLNATQLCIKITMKMNFQVRPFKIKIIQPQGGETRHLKDTSIQVYPLFSAIILKPPHYYPKPLTEIRTIMPVQVVVFVESVAALVRRMKTIMQLQLYERL